MLPWQTSGVWTRHCTFLFQRPTTALPRLGRWMCAIFVRFKQRATGIPPLPPHTVCCLPTMATSVSYTHGFRVLVGSFLYFGLIPRWDPALLAVGVMTADFYRYSLSLTVGVFAAIDPIISYLRPLGSTRSQFYSFHVQ